MPKTEEELTLVPERKELDEDSMIYNDSGELVPDKYVGLFKRNPNAANGSIADPRQVLCWKYYLNGLRQGRPNATRAAEMAGYSPNTALNVTNLKWFKDKKRKLRRHDMLDKAERNLDSILDMEYKSMKLVEGEMVEEIDTDKLKIVADISKVIAQTLGKDEGYSTKIVEDKNVNHDIVVKSISYADPVQIESEVTDVIAQEIINE